MDIFAIRLKRLIEDNHITMYRLAKDLNSSKQSVVNWCNGTSEPKLSYLRALAEYFDVTSDYLLGIEDEGGRRNGSIKNSFNNFTGNNGNISFK